MRLSLSVAAVLPALFTCISFGQEFSPEVSPFSSSPQSLQKAFANLEPGTNPVTILLEQAKFEFDAAGRRTFRHRLIFKVWTKAGAEGWAMIQRNWAPWQDDRPTVQARVIGVDGTVHELDPKTIADSPVRDGDDDVLTDRRMIRVPLPALEVGSVVEQEIVIRQVKPSPLPGVVEQFYFGDSVPVQQTILQLRVPQGSPLLYKARLLPDVVVSDRTEGDMRDVTFRQGAMKPREDSLPYLAPDEPRSPHVVFSTSTDWKSLAGTYASIVEEQLKGFDASKHLPKFPKGATRESKVLDIVDQLAKEIRYTGIEFSESSVIPHKPAEVLDHKYGDCKDKSTLAVALLRAAGLDAYVALLSSSTGTDIEPDLPGITMFNHAIVYMPGAPDIWLDPTDPDLRLSVISPPNQGRYALIARPQTTSLLRTPELTADDNRLVETREFHLAELGRAKVTERSEVFGTIDRDYRGDFGDREQKALLNDFKDYVDWTYGEAKIAAISHGERADLTRPFHLMIELDDAQRGTTARTEAAAAIRLSQITVRLPAYFREEPKKEKDDSKPPAPPRTSDFAIPEPFTCEWHYVIQAPAGFRVRQLPEPTVEQLGPASLTTRFTGESDTKVVGELRFVMPKRRFSAAEGLALRDAVVELGKRQVLLLYFDQVGETALASGNVKEALMEFDRLRKLHPTEALHAMQTARALLAAGAANTARAEARRAVALEPQSSKAYVQLSEVLKHDLVGRLMENGYDAAGAAAAYQRALELDPKDDATRANLAILLEYNQAAVRYGPGAKLEQALEEYRKVLDKLPELGLPNNYGVALLRAGRLQELKAHLAKQPDNENAQTLRICAEAMLNGAKVGISQAGVVSGVQAKQRVLSSAGQTLMQLRRYDLSAAMFEAAAAGAPNPAGIASLVQVLRKTKRAEDLNPTIKQPEDAIRVFMSRVLNLEKHENDWTEPLSQMMLVDATPEDLKDVRRGLAGGIGKAKTAGVPLEVAVDLGLSAAEFSRDGSDETGWVIRMTALGGDAAGSQSQLWFVQCEAGSYRILATGGEFEAVGRLVLQLVSADRLAEARTWLDRVRQEIPAGGGDDALSGSMFSRVWQSGQTADAPAIRLAAALLLTGKEKEVRPLLGILEEAVNSATPPARNFLSASLIEAYLTDKQYPKALAAGELLLRELPQSPTALALALRAAYATGGKKEADRIANPALENFKNNAAALRVIAFVAMSSGDTAMSSSVEKQIIDSGRGQVNDYNQLAWADVMADRVTPQTLETANRGVMLGNNQSTALMHTLAVVEAELDKLAEARALLLQRMTTLGEDEPDDEEWYAFGRIAERYGLTEEAAAMYRRLARPRNELAIPSSGYNLAQKRLKAMGQ